MVENSGNIYAGRKKAQRNRLQERADIYNRMCEERVDFAILGKTLMYVKIFIDLKKGRCEKTQSSFFTSPFDCHNSIKILCRRYKFAENRPFSYLLESIVAYRVSCGKNEEK